MSGKKFDQGKNRVELVPPEIIESIGEILTFGADKYGDFNWAEGIEYSRVLGALLRHILSFMKGRRLDPETFKPHLWHAACNLAFLITFEEHPDKYREFNNLFAYRTEGQMNGKEEE